MCGGVHYGVVWRATPYFLPAIIITPGTIIAILLQLGLLDQRQQLCVIFG